MEISQDFIDNAFLEKEKIININHNVLEIIDWININYYSSLSVKKFHKTLTIILIIFH